METNLEILHKWNKDKYLNIIEEFEIYKAAKTQSDHILNEKQSFESNIIYNTAIQILDNHPQKEQDKSPVR
jgi:hypothetical protein